MAVIFITRSDGKNNVNEGLCLKCAKELNIGPVSDIMKKMGIDEDQLDSVLSDMNGMLENVDENEAEDVTDEINSDDGMLGRTASFPFMNGLFPGGRKPEPDKGDASTRTDSKDAKKEKKKKWKFLDTYCVNLNYKYKSGGMDRIIGREKEINRTVQILCRRTKNNPCLIGEPGVGKTAIAEGIAMRIVDGKVPVRLLDSEIYLLDLAALVAGTQFRGQFESRIKGLVEEIKRAGNVILFIDEIHNLVGAGEAEGSMNAANILKPSLSRGEIQVIGATTFEEYRKYIEKDAALERRFQSVKVEEPSIADTIAMLNGIKDYYEEYHNVRVSSRTVARIVSLSERYITDRFLPDKAIDLLDEAATRCALRNKAAEDVAALKRSLKSVETEREMLESAQEAAHEPDEKLFEHLAEVKAEECRIQEQLSAYKDSELVGEVSDEDVANVIELWTGIPAEQIKAEELEQLIGLEDRIAKRIIGQSEAVSAVVNAVRRSRVRLSKTGRPASFIFVGPTGVGKTELVKVLAKELFDTPDALIRLDMSEFMEKHTVSRLVGSPPGYVGYDEAGQLTEKVRRKPYSVVLFDEIEKAHPDVMNILLQILDDGRITDAHGRTVNFENTIIVMTSNAGSERKDSVVGFGASRETATKEKSLKALREFLRPEFLGRVDEIITFRALDEDDYKKIAGIMLGEIRDEAIERGFTVSWTDDAVDLIVKHATGGNAAGAREIRHVIRREVEDKLAELIVTDKDAAGALKADAVDGKIELLKV